MNPYPSSFPKVRGGFAPYAGTWQPKELASYDGSVNGLGDLYSDIGVDPNYTGTQISTDNPLSISNVLASAPQGLWLLLGGFVVVSFLLPSGRR